MSSHPTQSHLSLSLSFSVCLSLFLDVCLSRSLTHTRTHIRVNVLASLLCTVLVLMHGIRPFCRRTSFVSQSVKIVRASSAACVCLVRACYERCVNGTFLVRKFGRACTKEISMRYPSCSLCSASSVCPEFRYVGLLVLEKGSASPDASECSILFSSSFLSLRFIRRSCCCTISLRPLSLPTSLRLPHTNTFSHFSLSRSLSLSLSRSLSPSFCLFSLSLIHIRQCLP